MDDPTLTLLTAALTDRAAALHEERLGQPCIDPDPQLPASEAAAVAARVLRPVTAGPFLPVLTLGSDIGADVLIHEQALAISDAIRERHPQALPLIVLADGATLDALDDDDLGRLGLRRLARDTPDTPETRVDGNPAPGVNPGTQ